MNTERLRIGVQVLEWFSGKRHMKDFGPITGVVGMEKETVKHLELIQHVVSRMGRNSFAYKGWAITLVAAIFALGVREGCPQFLLVALLPSLAFWGLDSYYLRQERLFRKLYDATRESGTSSLPGGPFSMDTSPYEGDVLTWWRTCWSKTIAGLYVPLTGVVAITAIIAWLINN